MVVVQTLLITSKLLKSGFVNGVLRL